MTATRETTQGQKKPVRLTRCMSHHYTQTDDRPTFPLCLSQSHEPSRPSPPPPGSHLWLLQPRESLPAVSISILGVHTSAPGLVLYLNQAP